MMFFPGRQVLPLAPEESLPSDFYVLANCEPQEDSFRLSVTASVHGRVLQREELLPQERIQQKEEGLFEYTLGRLAYNILSSLTGICPPWGILTGIRPIKQFIQAMERFEKPQEAESWFRDTMLVSEQKIRLGMLTAKAESGIIASSHRKISACTFPFPFAQRDAFTVHRSIPSLNLPPDSAVSELMSSDCVTFPHYPGNRVSRKPSTLGEAPPPRMSATSSNSLLSYSEKFRTPAR